jgi:hypothetical protein
VPESAAAHAERKRLAREAARRRSAVTMLQIAECGCRYAAHQLNGSGLGAAEARAVAVEMAAELAQAAEALLRLTRLSLPERRALARRLAAQGMPTRQVAWRVGVCERTVRFYLAGRPGPGGQAAGTANGAATGGQPRR